MPSWFEFGVPSSPPDPIEQPSDHSKLDPRPKAEQSLRMSPRSSSRRAPVSNSAYLEILTLEILPLGPTTARD